MFQAVSTRVALQPLEMRALPGCMVFVSSLARADDCRDSLMAESCACQSAVRSEREPLSASDKTSLGKKVARARNRVKARIARGARSSIGPWENIVVER